MKQSPIPVGVNAASYAAALISAALGEKRPVPETLEAVNRHLVGLAPDLIAAARPSATVAVAEIEVCGNELKLDFWAGGDAQVWALEGNQWRLVGGGSCCSPEVKERWRPRREALQQAGIPFEDIQQAEAEFYNDRSLFIHHTPVGTFPDLKLQHGQLNCRAVVVATDGALLDQNALGDLDAWMLRVREVERQGVPRLKTTDDLAVLYAFLPG